MSDFGSEAELDWNFSKIGFVQLSKHNVMQLRFYEKKLSVWYKKQNFSSMCHLKVLEKAVPIWPVSGQGFQNTKWPAVPGQSYILSKFLKSKKPANLNYHMSIKKSRAILKCL